MRMAESEAGKMNPCVSQQDTFRRCEVSSSSIISSSELAMGMNANECSVVVGGAVGANWRPRLCQHASGLLWLQRSLPQPV